MLFPLTHCMGKDVGKKGILMPVIGSWSEELKLKAPLPQIELDYLQYPMYCMTPVVLQLPLIQ